MIHKTILIVNIAVFFLACKPGNEATGGGTDKPQIYAVNYPLAYFTDRIGGKLIDVHFPETNGDLAFWKPKDADVRRFQKADLILLNGATYAKWINKVSLPESRTVNTSAHFQKPFIPVKNESTHRHGKDDGHSHTGMAFTTWLDLKQAEEQSVAIRDSLLKLVPDSEQTIKNNFAILQKDLRALDNELGKIAGNFGDTPLVGSHPVYQYLARAYNLKIRSVHWEPDEMPDENGWAELATIRKKHPAKIMLWEDEPSKALALKLMEQGMTSVVFDPCGNKSDKGDWLSVIQANISQLGSVAPEK